MADPYCLAMVLCDQIYRDPASGKFSILGTFSNFAASQFPTIIQLSVYFAVTDGLGPTTIRLQLIDSKAGMVDATDETDHPNRFPILKIEHTFDSPFQVLEGATGFQAKLDNPGVYHCELWASNVPIMSRRLTVLKVTDEGEIEK